MFPYPYPYLCWHDVSSHVCEEILVKGLPVSHQIVRYWPLRMANWTTSQHFVASPSLNVGHHTWVILISQHQYITVGVIFIIQVIVQAKSSRGRLKWNRWVECRCKTLTLDSIAGQKLTETGVLSLATTVHSSGIFQFFHPNRPESSFLSPIAAPARHCYFKRIQKTLCKHLQLILFIFIPKQWWRHNTKCEGVPSTTTAEWLSYQVRPLSVMHVNM